MMTVRALLAVSTLVLLLAGCYRHTAIKPTELPKLNSPSMGTVVGGNANGSTIAVATRTVERPNGQLVEIRGEFDLLLTTSAGDMAFSKPVVSDISDGILTVRSGNHGAWSAPISSVDSAKVEQPNRSANMFWGAVGGVLIFGIVMAAAAN
jgi:hypothetical protein